MEKLNVTRIRTNGGTQPRATLDEALAREYADALQDGATFPPVTVFYDGATYWLADGFHRHRAHELLYWYEIDADVRPGTLEDAQWYSLSANQTHGLRRTRADVERAVKAALRMRGVEKSDRQIAEHVGCSDKTVGKYRSELEAGAEIPHLKERKGQDGKTYPVPDRKPKPTPPATDPAPKTSPEPDLRPTPSDPDLPTLLDEAAGVDAAPFTADEAVSAGVATDLDPDALEAEVNPDTGEVETSRAEMLLSLLRALNGFKLDGPLLIGADDAVYDEAMNAQQMLTDWLGI